MGASSFFMQLCAYHIMVLCNICKGFDAPHILVCTFPTKLSSRRIGLHLICSPSSVSQPRCVCAFEDPGSLPAMKQVLVVPRMVIPAELVPPSQPCTSLARTGRAPRLEDTRRADVRCHAVPGARVVFGGEEEIWGSPDQKG